jgi:hypothetical protein
VHNAGFEGFRILLFQQDDGLNAASGEPGLKFGLDFGLGVKKTGSFEVFAGARRAPPCR